MSGIGSVPAARPDHPARPLLTALFLAYGALLLMRIGLNGRLLDLAINYTADGGSIVEKIHPTFWGFLAVGGMALVSFRITLDAWELRVVRALLAFCGAVCGLLAFAVVTGRSASVGYLLDSYVALIVFALVFVFPVPWRRALGHALLGYMVAGALLAIVEFALRFRLMPFNEGEAVFRPTGLTPHPLELGLWCAVGIGFTAAGDWPRGTKLAAGGLLLLGCVVSGARLATLVAGACTVLVLVQGIGAGLSPQRRRERQILVVLGVLLVGPVLLGGLAAAGAFGRFAGGMADDNAMARIRVYEVFGLLSWHDLLVGGDINAVVKLVRERYDLPYIESALVIFVVQLGILGTVLLLGMLARLVRIILIGAAWPVTMAVVAFFVVALSNNGLATKSSSVFLLLGLAITLHSSPATVRCAAAGARRC